MAGFLLGYPSTGGTDVNPQSTYQNKFAGLYIQDDFQVNSRLTLNLGLRWDVQTPSTERYNRLVAGFDPTVSYALGGGSAHGGYIYGSDDQRQQWSTNWRDFQPRFGLAYRAGSDLVLRGGYGIAFLPVNGGQGGMGGIQQDGYARRTSFVATSGGGLNSFVPALPGNGTFADPYPAGILQPYGSGRGAMTQVGQAVSFQNPDYVIPRVHQFNLGIARELPWKVTAEASYVGSRTRKFTVSKQLNVISMDERLKGVANPSYLNEAVANPFAGAPELAGTGLNAATITRTQSLYPYPQFTGTTGGVTVNGLNIGNSSYDSAQIRVNKRLSQGLTTRLDYTISKTLEQIAFREVQFTEPSRVLAGFDRTHHVTVFALYELPVGRGRRFGANWGKALDMALGNWQYNVLVEYMNGVPTNMPDATPVGDPRLPKGQQSYSRWFNTCTMLTSGARSGCASPDETIAWVQLKPNEVRTYSARFPNLRNEWRPQVSMSVFKTLPLTERVNLELRGEAFNAFNMPMYGGPNTSLTSAQFGVVTKDQQNFPRSMQFALRLRF